MAARVVIRSSQQTLLDALAGGVEPGAAWRAYRAAHADVLDLYAAAFGAPERSEAEIAGAVVGSVAALRRRASALALHELAPQVAQVLQLPDEVRLEAVMFVGWGRAVAWCDDEAARPRAYFALERVPDRPDLCRALGAHELAHLAHFQVRPGRWPPWSVLGGIFAEAVAIGTARALVPGLDPAAQLLLAPGALEAYAAARPAVDAELLGLLDAVDEATFRRVLFPPGLCAGDVAGVSETGYAVALALAESWSVRAFSIACAARGTPEQARAQVAALLAP